MKFLKIIPMMVILAGCTSGVPKSTVMITNLEGNSGGSGSVVASSRGESQILTNAHVCGVAKNGGLVHDDEGLTHAVTSYKVSKLHDLCLITAAGSIRHVSSISPVSPAFQEKATTIGHPHLLPTIITEGYFSRKLMITVVTGVKACTPEQLSAPDLGLICFFMGGLPIIKSYQSIVVSTLIQPGSSGSAVYGDGGKIAAVIFAGSSDLGYGLAVPYEYVYSFLNEEVSTIDATVPSSEKVYGSSAGSSSSTKDYTSKLKDFCKTLNIKNEVCAQVSSTSQDLIYWGQ